MAGLTRHGSDVICWLQLPVILTTADQRFLVELPGIEPAPKISLSCAKVRFGYVKRRESTRNDLRIRERCWWHQHVRAEVELDAPPSAWRAAFSNELRAGCQVEVGVDVSVVSLHRPRCDEKSCGNVFIADPLMDKTHPSSPIGYVVCNRKGQSR